MYLLDTNVVSELRRPRPHRAVLQWLGKTEDADLNLAAVTFGEIQAGIERARDHNPAKAAEIELWADRLAASFNIVPMDARIFRLWAHLMHHRSDDLYEDAMIAATARVHNLTVVTRNIRDFALFEVPIFDPFAG